MKRILALSLLSIVLNGCFHTRQPVPITEARWVRYNKKVHTVRRGETLYAIAWQHDTDYRTLARLNHLSAPYALKIDQKIRLTQTDKRIVPKKPQRRAVRRHVTVNKPAAKPRVYPQKISTWVWPCYGKIVQTFAKPYNNKGINIAGKRGQFIHASASGRVAYAGSGIPGYGKLLILKHNDLYLSAYAHNQDLLVKEGTWVKRGQVIARMGKTGTQKVMLHFEIRRTGKPVNPLYYLPKRVS